MRRRIMSLVAILTLAIVLVSGCGSTISTDTGSTSDSSSGTTEASGDSVKITYGNYGSSSMPPAMADETAIAYIEEASGGTITYNYIPDGVLGSESDMAQQVMDGTLECVQLATSTLTPYSELMEIFQLPFLIQDYEQEYEVMSSDYAQAIYDKVGEELGIKIVAVVENGMRHIANNIREVNSVADLSGLKIRIVSSNMLSDFITALGANPQVVAYNEVYTALQNNVVDGEEINLTSIYSMTHYEVLKYVTLLNMYPFPEFVVYNLDFWNSLTEEQQEIILEGHKKGSEELLSTYLPDYEAEATEKCEEYGIKITEVDDATRQEFIDIAEPIWDEYMSKDPLLEDWVNYVISLN